MCVCVCVCVCVSVFYLSFHLLHTFWGRLEHTFSFQVSSPETRTFSFQVSRNEGSVCLGTWGRGRAGQGGEGKGRGRAARAGQGRAGQGRGGPASNQTKIQFFLKIIFIIEHIKKL